MLTTNWISINRDTVFRHTIRTVSLLVLLIASSPFAEAKDVRWDELNLTTQQSNELERYESEWRRTYTELSPQIQRDSQELRQLMDDPHGDSSQLIQLQERINANRQRLQNEAMKTFLKKREKLSPEQRMHLQRMLAH